jgi:ABC-type multidrug transport system fused ATPase/permease subunit
MSVIQSDYEAKLEALQNQYNNELITEEEYNAQKDILDKQKAEKEAATVAMMDEKISKQKKKNKEKENAAKKRQFEANKGNQIAQAWINFAVGAIAAYVGAFQALGWMPVVGPALAIAMGTVMTGLLLGTTIAQTIAISQQKFTPEKYMGGRVDAGSSYSVNEYGQEIFTPGVTGYISPASVTDRIVENVQEKTNGKIINYNISFRGANITDRISLKSATDYVLGRMQTELEKAG